MTWVRFRRAALTLNWVCLERTGRLQGVTAMCSPGKQNRHTVAHVENAKYSHALA